MSFFKLSDETEKCSENLDSILSEYSSAVIAFSGGVDSTLLLETAYRKKNLKIMAVTVKTDLNTREETATAVEFLTLRNIKHILLEPDIFTEKKIISNPPDRCYHCKKFIFTAIRNTAAGNGFTVILDGSHSEDLDDYRPGLKALAELGITSPLKEAGFRKDNVRELAAFYGLNNWNSEASPCLATRIPFGNEINKPDLIRIEAGESFLRKNGFNPVRLRIHGNTARIEIHPDKFSRISDTSLRSAITDYIKSLGFNYVTLDIEGYRTGSMNIHK